MFWCSQFLSARESIKANFCFTYKWCDQTGGLIVQYCDICSYENLPNGIQNLPKSVQNLPNAHKTRQKVAKILPNLVTLRLQSTFVVMYYFASFWRWIFWLRKDWENVVGPNNNNNDERKMVQHLTYIKCNFCLECFGIYPTNVLLFAGETIKTKCNGKNKTFKRLRWDSLNYVMIDMTN